MPSIRILSVPFLVFAIAAPADARPISASDPAVEHCVVVVVDQAGDGELITSDPECFDTTAGAVAYADSEAVALLAAPAHTEAFTRYAALTTFTIGTHYDGLAGAGSSISVVGSNCGGGYWNTPTAWDNRISSTRNGCNRVKHHDNRYAGGSYASTWGVGILSNVPSNLNNKAESVSYWTS